MDYNFVCYVYAKDLCSGDIIGTKFGSYMVIEAFECKDYFDDFSYERIVHLKVQNIDDGNVTYGPMIEWNVHPEKSYRTYYLN